MQKLASLFIIFLIIPFCLSSKPPKWPKKPTKTILKSSRIKELQKQEHTLNLENFYDSFPTKEQAIQAIMKIYKNNLTQAYIACKTNLNDTASPTILQLHLEKYYGSEHPSILIAKELEKCITKIEQSMANVSQAAKEEEKNLMLLEQDINNLAITSETDINQIEQTKNTKAEDQEENITYLQKAITEFSIK